MKMKLWPLFLMVLMVFSVAQPIFADNPQLGETFLGDTKIAESQYQPLQDIRVFTGDSIELHAKLFIFCNYAGYTAPMWDPLPCRYLDFYVYKSNSDGTNGDLVWYDRAMTNFYTKNANLDEFTLYENGTYNLLVKYEGCSEIKPCSATAKIYVF